MLLDLGPSHVLLQPSLPICVNPTKVNEVFDQGGIAFVPERSSDESLSLGDALGLAEG